MRHRYSKVYVILSSVAIGAARLRDIASLLLHSHVLQVDLISDYRSYPHNLVGSYYHTVMCVPVF
jgi:hypothetical protein